MFLDKMGMAIGCVLTGHSLFTRATTVDIRYKIPMIGGLQDYWLILPYMQNKQLMIVSLLLLIEYALFPNVKCFACLIEQQVPQRILIDIIMVDDVYKPGVPPCALEELCAL